MQAMYVIHLKSYFMEYTNDFRSSVSIPGKSFNRQFINQMATFIAGRVLQNRQAGPFPCDTFSKKLKTG